LLSPSKHRTMPRFACFASPSVSSSSTRRSNHCSPTTIACGKRAAADDSQLPLSLQHQLCHAAFRRPPQQPRAIKLRR
jgi:hypothetical protein